MINNAPSCSCLPEFIGIPPNCRPECVSNSECPTQQACINQKCKDPCPGSCGRNTECRTISHTPMCTCANNFTGNPFIQCTPQPIEDIPQRVNPCQPSPCGPNAVCRESYGSPQCTCLPDFYGNPYENCRPECVINTDCPSNRACIRNKCQDPCPGTCSFNADCNVINHIPICSCKLGYTGDPFRYCSILEQLPILNPTNPCDPSPCGPNSRCRNVNGQSSCSCLPNFKGTPPLCRPECVVSTECASNRACINQKCVDPCSGVCGINAKCEVFHHSPICSCDASQTGDPFVRCFDMTTPAPLLPINPCVPSPCGPFSQCQDIGGISSCSCLPNYVGSAPNCRPECSINSDCTSNKACIREKCKDPCPGSCATNALCSVINHTPVCTCPRDYTGDPFTNCQPILTPIVPVQSDPCHPTPCGPNAICRNAVCSCINDYHGDPYQGCRPECVQNSDCTYDKACSNNKCVNPCTKICGQNAECTVINHIPTCSCLENYEGDPFNLCKPVRKRTKPCEPSPCGPNSICREFNEQASCTCLPGYFGIPPSCRPECLVNSDCEQSKACMNQRCQNPCDNTCGQNALCIVRNHNPICSCPVQYSGDPFVSCFPMTPQYEEASQNPCKPSLCGPNSQCTVTQDNKASCACMPEFIGLPPNCRPECLVNSECPSNQACVKQKCTDPCTGLCGFNALCQVTQHYIHCICSEGYTGDPFAICTVAKTPKEPPTSLRPCSPSPCGVNAYCREKQNTAYCECLPNFRGNPYEGCQPECLTNTDCLKSQACVKTKCQDPCPGTCGVGAICTVSNHIPICSCPLPTIGDAFTICQVIPEGPKERDPCSPSPCGPNTICEKIGDTAVCKCLPGLQGIPSSITGCHPECVISSDCPGDKACIGNKCVNPCTQNVCGIKATCKAINHSPLCSCPPPLIGNPFDECIIQIETDPCSPSPCTYNGECKVRNGIAICIYPECVINSDCPREKACFGQKCKDPCIGACGINSLCQTVNHKPVCSCPIGFTGNARIQCTIPTVEEPVPECIHNSECPNDKTCYNQKCIDPCTLNSCGFNSRCHVQLHRAVCVCNEGFTGNPQQYCGEIGCRGDSDCPLTQSCVNNECIDTCSVTQCGINAFCESDGYHRPRCYCPDGYLGNPYQACERSECITDNDCPSSLSCRDSKCINPCDCPLSAQCHVINHRPICRCPPGYVGNPYTSCLIEPIEQPPQCQVDGDCPSKLGCFSGVCKDPCVESKPCIAGAKCSVVNTLPMRTMICECLPNFAGDATVACIPVDKQIEAICKADSQCASNMSCLNERCINPCIINPCASNAECLVQNHYRQCHCSRGTAGDPFVNCYRDTDSFPECTSNLDCAPNEACINELCQNPCVSTQCGLNAECVTVNHHPTCHCKQNFAGDPQIQCFRPECKSDSDCPYDKTCQNNNCITPCLIGDIACGRGAECIAVSHRAQCVCPRGTQGDPRIACISTICHYNEDCADHEACDRLNRVCRPVCEDDICAETAKCIAKDHQPKCVCPLGTTGNPYIDCAGVSIEPECKSDSECPSYFACINTKCQDPCLSSNMCSADQECKVLNTVPLRTMICSCPPNTITDINGSCKKIVQEDVQCHQDQDCIDSDKCVEGTCIEACLTTKCGLNAQCKAISHTGICYCAPEFTGNAYIECIRVPIILPPRPECYSNNDCSNDKQCINSFCMNPCIFGNPCGRNALCYANNHSPVCRCPANYIGDSKINCEPPKIVAECTSNNDCAGNTACVNNLCINPCNCGANAKCNVVDHYPSCICSPGYSGNPQLGCFKLDCESDSECNNAATCYNGQCVNPCILENKCAINAECYGQNHRAICRCGPGYLGNPEIHCERVECTSDYDCPRNLACYSGRCISPCIENPPCAQNAICYVQDHVATCRCPENIPAGNPYSYCTHPKKKPDEPECRIDIECANKLVCIKNKCIDPCPVIKPCLQNARCNVLDTVPVRTMTCTCPEGWTTDIDGVCRPIQITIIGTCTTNDECSDGEACINRQCRNPCNCGTNAACYVRNHKPICSCEEGYQGNPDIACYSVECTHDSECALDKSCVNNNCVNPCLISDNCGVNAECYPNNHKADCRCRQGYHGNSLDRCRVIGCYSNGDCPGDHSCINMQCINPCVHSNPCSSLAECRVFNHLPICRCPVYYIGNPYIACKPEERPECKEDSDCPNLLACFDNKCQNPCSVVQPCSEPSECRVLPTSPVRTMVCVCPSGYVSSGSGTCRPTKPILKIECARDSDCPSDKSCVNAICKNPCACGPNADCSVVNHKPICSCVLGYDGNPDVVCTKVAGCRTDSECSGSHACVQHNCVPVCSPSLTTCGKNAECHGINHKAICECLPGFGGNPRVSCVLLGCKSNSDCPTNKACINNRCENPCAKNPCTGNMDCNVYNHIIECACPPGYIGDAKTGCVKLTEKCKADNECPSQTACFNGECINPCVKIEPCGINADCKVLDTSPVRTMICECIPGYRGNAVIRCDKTNVCAVEKNEILDEYGNCVCPPGSAKDEKEMCIPCRKQSGMIINEEGYCVCALENGMIIDEYGRCVCPTHHGYRLDANGYCKPADIIECKHDDDCADNRFCDKTSQTCEDPCSIQLCGLYALCNATRHQAICICINGYIGNAYTQCYDKNRWRTDFPRPEMVVSCLSDGVQVEIHLHDQEFDGVLYVKGHSKDEQCRRVVSIPAETMHKTEIFKVAFGNCGLIHVNGQASFVLVIQKHPKLMTYKTQAYHIKCIYQTGEQNVTLGFNVSMLTTAGTIANTGPPPVCLMKIVTQNGNEISSAEIGDNLMLQVEVQPSTIYGGFARNCVAKTMEDKLENEYIVTDENGCATDPTIFKEWEQNPETQTLMASFNAFKFPSSDNIRFQCNIRVCFGRCQPVNCRGYNAFGRRRRDVNSEINDTSLSITDNYEGQLREEITIQSNLIFTLEKQERLTADPAEIPAAQRVEDICVSMVGFVIALVITALLALVAVAIAVSCWLMAYRRQPKTAGPLPHPPEFPNPLFTTESVAEPSPDYHLS